MRVEGHPPGLCALSYRAGTFATFYETMLARLSNLAIDVPSAQGTGTDTLYPLRSLTARDTSDAAIALLVWFIGVPSRHESGPAPDFQSFGLYLRASE